MIGAISCSFPWRRVAVWAIPKVRDVTDRASAASLPCLQVRAAFKRPDRIPFANYAENLFRPHPRGSELAKRLQVSWKAFRLVWKRFCWSRPRGKRWIKNATKLASWALFEPSSLGASPGLLNTKLLVLYDKPGRSQIDALLYICNIVIANLPSVRLRHLFFRRYAGWWRQEALFIPGFGSIAGGNSSSARTRSSTSDDVST